MKKEPSQELVAYVEEHVLPCYEGVDPAHGKDHILTVLVNSLRIAENHDVDIDMVYCIAVYHDIGIRYGRDDHEITSARWLREDQELLCFFSKDQIQTMAEAVEDHRASSKNPPRSIYGCIIAEADRDLSPNRIIARCADFAIAHHPGASEDEIVRICLNHLEEKYGPEGYLKLYLFDPRNEEGLRTLRLWMADGSMEQRLKEYLKTILFR